MARMRVMTIREMLEKIELDTLVPRAARSAETRGRDRDEPEDDIRPSYQRDRDRIVHSKAFRRLKHKTQVFLAPEGDHYRTRLTHVLEVTQTNIRKFRPWYDASFRDLTILRRLTESFPEDGTVSAKQIEIRSASKPGELLTVSCTGTARSREALAVMMGKLGKAKNVTAVHTQQERGTSPMEFTFDFKWSEGQ